MPTSPRATRAALPAPRPLSPRAAAFLRTVEQREAARGNAIAKAVTTALTEVTKAETKQAKTPQRAVYDQAGNLVGVVDPERIMPAVSPTAPGKPKGARQPIRSAAADEPMLGGPTPPPRAGVPVQVVQDEEDEEEEPLAKAVRLRKAALHAHDPAERVAAFNELNAAVYAAIRHVQQRGTQSRR